MSDVAEAVVDTGQQIRDAAAELQAHRTRPCLLFISRQIVHGDVVVVREAMGGLTVEALDVVVSSPGGNVEAAYLVAREFRRRVKHLTVFVPFQVKSAATLLAVVADEVVLGSLGELGPLDAQYDEKQAADFPRNTSHLLLDTALREMESHAMTCYDAAVQRIIDRSGMRPFEAASKAAEFMGTLYGPLMARFDPARLAESSRGLALGGAYASRLLRRYRPAISQEDRERLLDRLVRGYPAHSFIIDQEEASEMGLPVRPPDRAEAKLLDRLALTLIEFGTEDDVIAMAGAPRANIAAAQKVLESMGRSRDGNEETSRIHGPIRNGKRKRR